MEEKSLLELIEGIYKHNTLDEIPWNIADPPEGLLEIVESRKVKPCRTVDLGCGTGNYSIYLATEGFVVTGVDFSPSAIKIAKLNAADKEVACKFISADLIGELNEINTTFDFAFDWELLHHIFPEAREKYLNNVCRLLNSGGKYLSVSFSEEDPQFGGKGKFRATPLGTDLYFSSKIEMKELFGKYFEIEEIKTVDVKAKNGIHKAVYFFGTKI